MSVVQSGIMSRLCWRNLPLFCVMADVQNGLIMVTAFLLKTIIVLDPVFEQLITIMNVTAAATQTDGCLHRRQMWRKQLHGWLCQSELQRLSWLLVARDPVWYSIVIWAEFPMTSNYIYKRSLHPVYPYRYGSGQPRVSTRSVGRGKRG